MNDMGIRGFKIVTEEELEGYMKADIMKLGLEMAKERFQ